jgi:hypothetical protein
MNSTLKDSLRETSAQHHGHLLHSFAYMVAGMEAKLLNDYCLMHVRQKPWWVPEPFYRWLLSQSLVLTHFKK